MDLAVLLSLPVESIAIRAILAAVATVVLVRLLLRSGLRSPRARVTTALAPALAIVAVVALTGASPRLPTLMVPVQGQALPIPVRGGYVHFAPMAVPLLLALWGSIVGILFWRRSLCHLRARRHARAAVRLGASSQRVRTVTRSVAARLGLQEPPVAVSPTCSGGAMVIGSRRPVVMIGEELATRLDEEELEGVLAHELAHVKRRDNLVAAGLSTLRDAAFFVPGAGWAVRRLHRERELAADQLAVSVTGRPGALASGLLKAVEGAPRAHGCAAFAPSGNLVDRVRVLLDNAPAPSRVRHTAETIAVLAVVATATAAALTVPAAIAGPEGERDAVAVVWSSASVPEVREASGSQTRVFDVYRSSELEASSTTTNRSMSSSRVPFDESSQEYRRGPLTACGQEGGSCPAPDGRVGLGLRPQPTITVDDALVSRWRATPLAGARSGEGLRLYWLAVRSEAREASRDPLGIEVPTTSVPLSVP